jgi:hypothetical protein
MAKERFIEGSFRKATLAVIDQANAIIGEFTAQGFVLTLRQLYYQFVSRDLIENKQAEYKRLGVIIKNGRRAGLIDWSAIEDRTRTVHTHPSWDDPAEIISTAADQYRSDPWEDQAYRPEVWIEKDALLGVIESICRRWRVPYFACRGNNSETMQYQAGKRFAEYVENGFFPLVLHLGDHDPNGLDMTRDNTDRLATYARGDVEVRRLALNMGQVERYRPPPNFAKETDTRYNAYVRRFNTTKCWELDALNPTVIAALIGSEIESLIDRKAWDSALAKETEQRRLLGKASANWVKVERFLKGGANGPTRERPRA